MSNLNYLIIIAVVMLSIAYFILKPKRVIETEIGTGTGSKKLPRSVRNNNPGNIKINPANNWKGKLSNNTDGVFEQFDTMENGARAQMILLRNYFKDGVNTVSKIIHRYAPPFDAELGVNNPTESYIKAVSRIIGRPKDEVLNLWNREELINLAYAISQYESGNYPEPKRDVFEAAYNDSGTLKNPPQMNIPFV